jgi:hypothetical protein
LAKGHAGAETGKARAARSLELILADPRHDVIVMVDRERGARCRSPGEAETRGAHRDLATDDSLCKTAGLGRVHAEKGEDEVCLTVSHRLQDGVYGVPEERELEVEKDAASQVRGHAGERPAVRFQHDGLRNVATRFAYR